MYDFSLRKKPMKVFGKRNKGTISFLLKELFREI
jgi:hypothetical protein